ncbi:MAG: hypothetical protein R2724_15995 [Bryobacterales bacterium]
MRLSLDSIRMVRSGKSTREKVLWKDEQLIPAARLSRGWQGVSIPVEFRIPADAEESSRGSYRCLWRLSAAAAVAGVDFHARFEAPVYRTAESARAFARDTDEPNSTDSPAWTFASDHETAFDPAQATFIQRPSPMGGVEYYFPARSQRRGGMGMFLFLMLWLGALAVMLHFEAPCSSWRFGDFSRL